MDDNDPWPFGVDADRDHPLTKHRIAVTSAWPGWFYLVAFDYDSEAEPTDVEVAMLASYLDEYKNHWYNPTYLAKLARRDLDVDGGANGVIFHKYGPDDWGYRRRSWNRGPTFFPGSAFHRERWPSEYGTEPMSLARLMDHIHTIVDTMSKHWVEWKAAHPDVFGEVSAR